MTKNKHIGSNFDDFLAEDNQLDEATAIAVKRVIAWQIEQAMQSAGVNKSALAKRMHTSRTVVDRSNFGCYRHGTHARHHDACRDCIRF